MRKTTDLVVQWAIARNIIEGSTPEKQLEKLAGEVIELTVAVNNDKHATHGAECGYEVMSEIGDCVVVLTIIAEQMGFDLEACLEVAYDKIKDRKGKMINGKFVKEEDL